MASKKEALSLKKGDVISWMNDGEEVIINDMYTKEKYPGNYGEIDECITINGLDWYFDEITISPNKT